MGGNFHHGLLEKALTSVLASDCCASTRDEMVMVGDNFHIMDGKPKVDTVGSKELHVYSAWCHRTYDFQIASARGPCSY